jgi:3-oxoadipate enol-lactonase
MSTLSVDGRELYYEDEGEGPAVVLVHSGIADSSLWDAQVDALSARFRVIRYDIAGFGRSRLRPGPLSHGGDLQALLEHLGIERASLVGNCFGGRISLEYTLRHPDAVEALVLVAPALRDHRWSPETQRVSDEEERLFDEGDFEGAADGQVRLWVDGPAREPEAVDDSVREHVRAMILRSYEVYAEAAKAGEPGPDEPLDPPASARLGEVRAPTLIVIGAADVPDMLEISERLERGIRGAQRIVVSDAAHALPLERPEELNRLLLDFLTR